MGIPRQAFKLPTGCRLRTATTILSLDSTIQIRPTIDLGAKDAAAGTPSHIASNRGRVNEIVPPQARQGSEDRAAVACPGP